jgi:NADPH2:quinone reductase
MKAIVVESFGEPDVLQYRDVETPQAGPDSVLIKVEAAAVNFADVMMRSGAYPGGPAPGFIPGLEVAGTIVAGDNVGQRVAALTWNGGYAEYAVADKSMVFPVPEGMSTHDAAGLLVTNLTAYFALWMADLKPDERVLIHAAAGGVGTAAVQLAREMGAEIFGTASSEEKLARVKQLGAEHTINYAKTDFVEEVRRLTGGEGVDIVLDMVGGDVFDRSLDLLRTLGRMIVYGAASGEVRAVNPGALMVNNTSVHGLYLGGLVSDPELLKMAMDDVGEYIRRGKLKIIVGRQFPLEQAAEAHRYIQSRESFGKILLTV